MNQVAENITPSFIDQLSDIDLPALGGVLNELKKILETPVSSAAELAEVILNDASLTAKLLRIANSVYYNPTGNPINTVSRAVVQLGIAKIKSICVSAIVLDEFRDGAENPRLLTAIADSVHIAIQAKSFFDLSGQCINESEEIMVAGLLRKLGEIAFWSELKIDDELKAKFLQASDKHLAKTQQKTLGFSFDEITEELCSLWSLSDVLQESLNVNDPTQNTTEAAIALDFGAKLVESLSSESSENNFEKITERISEHYDLEPKQTAELIENNFKQAITAATSYGAKELCASIEASRAKANGEEPENIHTGKVDETLLKEVKQELAAMNEDKVELNILFHTTLEGLHRAVGLERVAIAMLDKQQEMLNAKYVIGTDMFPWPEKFSLRLSNHVDFENCVRQKKAVVVDAGSENKNAVGSRGATLLAPILVGNKILGIYYADCGEQLKVDRDRLIAFNTLCALSNKTLSSLVGKR